MRKSLSRNERLRSQADFAQVFNGQDHRSGCRGARLVAKRNGLGFNRFAATLVRKFGNAVERNHARRILKEIYRIAKADLPQGYDIIVVLYPGNFSYVDREKQFSALIRSACFGESDS